MRLISTFDTEKDAYAFYSFLLKEGIQNVYEPFVEQATQTKRYRLWVYEEENLELALDWLQQYQAHPEDSRFHEAKPPLIATPPPPDYGPLQVDPDLEPPLPPQKNRSLLTLTHLLLALCVALFLWNTLEDAAIEKEYGEFALQITFSPLYQKLLFDYPSALKYYDELLTTYPIKTYTDPKEFPAGALSLMEQAQKAPIWKGLYNAFQIARAKGWDMLKTIPLFEKIRQGEFWRLFTPCLIHRDFLHILFNMAWLWMLGRQIEERLRTWKIILLLLIIGIISNFVQYLVSGPFFMGFSGVIMGMAGFIWMRQRKAPWEGYPLSKGTLLFLLLFVAELFLLEVVTFGLELFSVINVSPQIANTAHIIGGLCGLMLGRLKFFSRRTT